MPLDSTTFVGRVFVRWTVLSFHSANKKYSWWLCRCECGTERKVRHDSLVNGGSVSCGCLGREIWVRARTKHDHAYEAEYGIWKGAISRCCNPSNKSYKNYGGRGIGMCGRWRDSLENFLADMGPRPSSAHTLERIDNNKGYDPNNCRWATRKEQARNQRTNRFLTHNGKTLTIAEWAEVMGISRELIKNRLNYGWSVDRILTTPCRPHKEYNIG